MHRAKVIPILAGLLLLGACSSWQRADTSEGFKAASQRKAAPAFSLKDADGRTVQLSDYRGKVVLLNFWATWCGPCQMEIPWFVEFEREHKDKGFAVIGVSMDDDGWDAVKPFITEFGVNYRILMGSNTVGDLYGGVDALPTSFIIDRQGRIAAVHIGLVSKSKYEEDLNRLLEGPSNTADAGGAGRPIRLARAE